MAEQAPNIHIKKLWIVLENQENFEEEIWKE